MSHFNALTIYSCEKHCEKRRNCCNKQFLLFSQCFLPFMALIFRLKYTLKMSSATCFNLEQSKILSTDNALIKFYLKSYFMTDSIYLLLSSSSSRFNPL